MKILVDMNLSPRLAKLLSVSGIESRHWSQVGKDNAQDLEIFNWARNNGYVVLTHDLDFGNILAITNAEAPSVIQIRTLDITPENLLPKIHAILNDFEIQLNQGVLVVLEETSARYRILPLTRQ